VNSHYLDAVLPLVFLTDLGKKLIERMGLPVLSPNSHPMKKF